MSGDNQSYEHWLSKNISKLREKRDGWRKTHPQYYYPILAVFIIAGITIHHFYESWLDKLSGGGVVKSLFYIFWILVIAIFFALDKNRSKKFQTPMSWEPWMLILGFAALFLVREINPPVKLVQSSPLTATNTVYLTTTNFIQRPQWYVKIKGAKITARGLNQLPNLSFRIALNVNGQKYGWPSDYIVIHQEVHPPEWFPIIGDAPYHISFSGWLFRDDDASQPIRLPKLPKTSQMQETGQKIFNDSEFPILNQTNTIIVSSEEIQMLDMTTLEIYYDIVKL